LACILLDVGKKVEVEALKLYKAKHMYTQKRVAIVLTIKRLWMMKESFNTKLLGQ